MSESSRKYSKLLILIVLLLAAVVLFIKNTRTQAPGTGNPYYAFYFDEETSAEIIRPAAGFPPFLNDNGKPALVQAFKYSYDDGRTSKIAYLFKYSDDAKAKLEALTPDDINTAMIDPRPAIMQRGELVRSPEPGSEWMPIDDPRVHSIRALPSDSPNGQSARWIYPPRR